MGIILKNQNLNIASGYFEFLMKYDEEKLSIFFEQIKEESFCLHFKDYIKNYMQRKLIWRLPEKFLTDLTKTHKLSFLFQIEVESPNNFFIGTPGKIKFSIKRNYDENINIYNRENVDYYICLEKYSKNWLIIGNIQNKVQVYEEHHDQILEFEILPLVLGYIELPKFQITSIKNNVLLMASELKQEDMEKLEIENKFCVKNSELLINYLNGNNVMVCSYEKTKADYAVFV